SVQDTIRFNFCYGNDIWEEEEVREFVLTQDDYSCGVAATDTIGFNSSSLADFPIKMQFKCDMREEMQLGNFEKGDKLFIWGDFNNWSGIDYELHDVYGDSVYSRTFQNFKLHQNISFNFVKYSNGNYQTENFDFRKYELLLLGFNSYLAPWEEKDSYHLPKSIQVQFSVNLELERLTGLFNPLTDSIFIGGGFNGWQKQLMQQSQTNQDIYLVTIPIPLAVDDTINFNFCLSPDKWEIDGVRHYIISQSEYANNSAGIISFGLNYPSVDSTAAVFFRCNMSVQMKRGTFAATDSVWVRGNFNDWAGKAFLLTDPDGDSVYSGLYYNFTVGQSLVFKYTNNHAGNDVWESTGNRTLTVGVGPNFTSACWEDVCVYIPSKIIKVAFSVNMELERLSRLFNPATNLVSVRGSFNGWGETLMTASTNNADLYEVVADVIAAVDEKISFKFFYSPGTWEVNNLTDMTQNDRYFIVNQSQWNAGKIDLDSVSFNNADFGEYWFFLDILFTCNTKSASIKNALEGTEFKTISLAGGVSPLSWPGYGWPDKDIYKTFQLYDDGTNHDAVAGDKIFSTLVTFYHYTPKIAYKYCANWGLLTNGGNNDNELIPGEYHMINISENINRLTSFVAQDTFGVKNTNLITDLEKHKEAVPTSFSLSQNYPNPFNPETVISWQIAVGSFVTLEVFDVLGNEVATLVNEEQPAGSYQIEFSSKNRELSSGVYFYQLRAGDFVQTKKMILLR
ncbi:MAG: T9SS type A sorting domain-containing protein, partial [Ignavibacteriaceae bacterium]